MDPAGEKRSYGKKILLGSGVVAAVGAGPLLLYILLGPANGNPVGLGLLAMLALPLAAIGAIIGTVTLAVEWFVRARN
jgi:hypothetical protein